jgi:LemA protein
MRNLKPIHYVLGVLALIAIIGFSVVSFWISTFNELVLSDENVKGKWSQVENQYQRRYDLIPNLVEVVKGYAAHEKETLEAVTSARSKMGGVISMDKNFVNNAAAMKRFSNAQAGMAGALQRLMVVSERYPDLKANQNFLDLQVQLEGTENRIATERRRYNEAVQMHNTMIRFFFKRIVASFSGIQKAEHFKMEESAQAVPKVKF